MASISPAIDVRSEPPVSARILAVWLGLGAVAVVLLAAPSALFDLDRFAVPKELALQVTALGALLLLGLTAAERATLVAAEIPLIAFVGWSALSALVATNRWLGMRALAVTVAGVVLFRAGRRVAAQGAGGILLIGLAIALILAALTGLAQAYGFETSLLAESRAPGGTLGNRNFLAHLLAIGVPLLLLLVLEARGPRRAALAATGLGLMLGAIVLTRSRAAWLGVAASGAMIGVGWLVATHKRPGFLAASRIRLALIALAVGAAAALLLPNGLSWRSESPYRDTMRDLTNYHEGSGHGRLIQYRNSLRLVTRDPIFGTGPGNWPVIYPLVTTPGDPSFAGRDPMPTNPWPSSDWVAFLTERGMVAVILLLAVLAAMGLTAARRLRSEDRHEVARSLALLGLLTATVVTGAFDAVLLLAAPTLVIWTAAGLLLPTTGSVTTLPVPVRSRLLPALAAFGLAATARSAGQLGAILRAGTGWPLERLERAVRLDPGNYRLHLMIAERAGCARGREHAAAAERLFPYLPAPRRRLAMCGYRLSATTRQTGPAGPISTGGPPSLPHSLQDPSYTA